MENLENTNKQQPPPPKNGESILEYAKRISGDPRSPDQIKQDSEKEGKLPTISKKKRKK
jgi:hypothetical protein